MIPVSRRGLLATIAAGVAGSAAARNPDASEYVIEQGDRCVPITPLSGDETAEAFYDYRTPNTDPSGPTYSSHGTTDLQRPDTSIAFLYEGPEGLSLVVVHDELRDGTPGGAVTFDIGLEHPDRGRWLVGDDDYDAPTNYDTFARTDTGWRIDWTWAEGRSDGGVYGHLGDDFAMTIDPAFNRQAALYGDHYEGEITDWQFLTGDRADPERVSLALDRPLTIRPGSCGERTTTPTTTRDEGSEKGASGSVSADVEVLPGRVNPRSHGRLPVVVRSTETFDATALAPGTVEFGPGDANPVERIRTDADGDGRADLKLHFRMDATGIDWETDRVRLTGETETGRAVVGEVEVRLVTDGDEDDEEEAESEDEESDDEDDEEAEDRDEEDHREDEDDGEEEDEDDDDEDDDEEEDEDDDEDDDEESEDDDEEEEDDDEEDEEEDEETEGRPGRGRGRGEGRGRGRGEGRANGEGHDEDD